MACPDAASLDKETSVLEGHPGSPAAEPSVELEEANRIRVSEVMARVSCLCLRWLHFAAGD